MYHVPIPLTEKFSKVPCCISKEEANHLANNYAREYKLK